MRSFTNEKALTLTELIMASAVVGIVMMGVVSSDYAIRKHSDAAFNGAILSVNTQGILNHITNNAYQANGSTGNPGIVIGTGGNGVSVNTFAIRINSVGPVWICYTLTGGHLYTCSRTAAGSCSSGDTNLGIVQSIAPNFTTNNVAGSVQMVFTVTVTSVDSAGNSKTVSANVSPPGYSM